MTELMNNRRDFLKKSIIAAAGITIIPRHVLGGNGFLAPCDQLTKAMGQGHIV